MDTKSLICVPDSVAELWELGQDLQQDKKDVYFFRIFSELHYLVFYGKFTEFYS